MPLVAHRFRPDNLYRNWFQHHGANDDLAAVVSSRLLKESGSDLTFEDLNPARPNLILNATNVTSGRSDFDENAYIPPNDQRPLTDDDALHFAFTQQYFWRLWSDLDKYPVKEALVASAAFPLIIDRPSLRVYRPDDIGIVPGVYRPRTPPKCIALYDGGVHDETARLLSNRLLFDAVKKVQTNFKLPKRDAWLLRYNARWVVAHRVWQLCTYNRPLLDAPGPDKARQACEDPLPNRPFDDDVGSDEFRRVSF